MFCYSTVKFELIEQNYTVVTVSYTTDAFWHPEMGATRTTGSPWVSVDVKQH